MAFRLINPTQSRDSRYVYQCATMGNLEASFNLFTLWLRKSTLGWNRHQWVFLGTLPKVKDPGIERFRYG